MKESNNILAQFFLEECLSAVVLNLNTGKAWIAKCDILPELSDVEYEWHELIRLYEDKSILSEDAISFMKFNLDNISKTCQHNGDRISFNTRITMGDNIFKWVEITINTIGVDKSKVIMRIRDIDENIMMRKILDSFVYQNYDYLLLIDSKNDSYIRFSGSKETIPIPADGGQHYTDDMIEYNKSFVLPENCQRVTDNMQLSNVIKRLEENEIYSFTSGGITKDGRYRHTRVNFSYADKSDGLIVCARTDVTQIYLEEQEKNERLAEALRNAQNDPLTGIYNQKATANLVERSLETRYHNIASVFFIDVDNFKMVNDTYGHQKGDELLCFMGHQIRKIAGRDGIAGRLGGDEFLLYLPSIRSIQDIRDIGDRVCQIFKNFSDNTVDSKLLSCSVGISLYPKDGTDYEELMRKADQALYVSKRYGKNKYYFYSES